jgi:hypothetical protein
LVTIVSDARDDLKHQVTKTVDDIRAAVDARLEALERRVHAPGVLPPVKAWREGMVTYEGELTVCEGSLFQARFDTGVKPSEAEAWTRVARAGKDAAQITPRGEWNTGSSYRLLDLATYEGCSWLATRDNPSKPLDDKGGWQLISARGAKGEPGLRGDRGERGARGTAEEPTTIIAWTLDLEKYLAIPELSNGQIGAALNLRPMFEQFHGETGAA